MIQLKTARLLLKQPSREDAPTLSMLYERSLRA